MLDFFSQAKRQARQKMRIDGLIAKYKDADNYHAMGRYVLKLLSIGSDDAVDAVLNLAMEEMKTKDDIIHIVEAFMKHPNPKAIPVLTKAFYRYSNEIERKRPIPRNVKQEFESGRGSESDAFAKFGFSIVIYQQRAEDVARAIRACGGDAPAVPKPSFQRPTKDDSRKPKSKDDSRKPKDDGTGIRFLS